MGRTAAFAVHELRTQARSLRFRVAAVTYVALGSLPAVLTYSRRSSQPITLGGATYAGETVTVLPLLTAVLAILLSLDGIGRERSSNSWTTVALTDLTNAGYLLRRWIALQAIVVPLTVLPLLIAAGIALAAGHQGTEPSVFWGPWLVHILPLALLGTTLGLGLGTLGGNGMGTFVTAILFLIGVPWLADSGLSRLGYGFAPPIVWLDPDEASFSVARISRAFRSRDPDDWAFPAPATEAGYDLGTAAEQSLPAGLLFATVSTLVLGLAVAHLRRTRPDLRPWTVRPDHPLRSFLGALGRLREAFVIDPALAPADRIALALGLLLALAAGAASVARTDLYDEIVYRQIRAEMKPPEPMPRDVLPGAWRVEGAIADDGEAALRVTGTLRNAGREPRGHLAFSLAPGLEVLEATAGVGRVQVAHVWDRLTAELDPPLRPGESRELRFRLGGRPAKTVFPRRPKHETLVDDAFGAHQRARFGRDLVDLSSSYRVPAVSGYRVHLNAEDLFPVPRYGPWTFTMEWGMPRIEDEVFFPPAEVSLSLAVPPGLFIADSCGSVARDGRLESRCRLPLPELMLAGGRHQVLAGAQKSGATVAVFPSHRAAGELHLGFLARSSRMLGEAWPGLGRLEGMVVLEWPSEEIHTRNALQWFFRAYQGFDDRLDVQGRLIFLSEASLISQRPIEPEGLVAEIVTSRLERRRRIHPDQQAFFRQLFRTLALQRLGLGPQGGAVVGPLDHKDLPKIEAAALGDAPYTYWRLRFPALIAALEHRAGAEPLRAAVDELLAGPASQPATFEEFEQILRRHSREPVDGMIRDFFRDKRMPELVLEDVEFRRAGELWRATGRVRNLATGEAVCRLVLAAAVAPVETTVTVGTREAVLFSLETPHQPQAVLLDPDLECHRLVSGMVPRDRVYFKGER